MNVADDTEQQAPTDGTVQDLKDHLDTVTDPAEVERLKQAETDGQDRTTAHAALDAKAAELSDQPGGEAGAADHSDANVTSVPGDQSADASHDDTEAASTVLAQVPHPAELSDDDINNISGGGLKDDAAPQQADAAYELVRVRDEAQGKEPDVHVNPFNEGPGGMIA
jgi:hypothetical protein